MKNALIILIVIMVIGVFVYFVSGVSATSAPIKKYQFSGSVDQLITGLRRYASNIPNMTFKVTDTTGSLKDGYAIYMDVNMIKNGHHFQYSLKCEKNSDNSEPATTRVILVFAYDATNISGGYRKSARGVKILVDNFDTDFLVGLKNGQNIKLNTVPPTFLDPLKHVWNGD